MKLALCARLVTALAALACSAPALAVTPFPFRQGFEADQDSYTPANNSPLGDPLLSGLPPGVGDSHLGGAPDHIPGADWIEFRSGGAGILEEVASGHRNDLGAGISAGNGSAHFGLLQPDATGDGPFGLAARQVTPPGFRFSAQTDLFIDPALTANDNGVVDFWWTNAVNARDGSGSYTEAGLTGEVSALNPGTWDIKTTSGAFVANVPAGNWVTLEVEPVRSAGGGINFTSRVWDIDHQTLLGALTAPEYTGLAEFDLMGGPQYNWFTFFEPNVPYLFVDNVGWAAAITPLPTVRGDANGDGFVNFADLTILLNHYKKPGGYTEGDFDATSFVDFADLTLLLNFYKHSVNLRGESMSLTAVPEPESLAMAALGLAALTPIALRRKRRACAARH